MGPQAAEYGIGAALLIEDDANRARILRVGDLVAEDAGAALDQRNCPCERPGREGRARQPVVLQLSDVADRGAHGCGDVRAISEQRVNVCQTRRHVGAIYAHGLKQSVRVGHGAYRNGGRRSARGMNRTESGREDSGIAAVAG